jgi:hypothetical protein
MKNLNEFKEEQQFVTRSYRDKKQSEVEEEDFVVSDSYDEEDEEDYSESDSSPSPKKSKRVKIVKETTDDEPVMMSTWTVDPSQQKLTKFFTTDETQTPMLSKSKALPIPVLDMNKNIKIVNLNVDD